MLFYRNNRDGERERDISGTVRQCEKYYMDLLSIESNGGKTGKNKTGLKTKVTNASEAVHVVNDLEFWTSTEDQEVIMNFVCIIMNFV